MDQEAAKKLAAESKAQCEDWSVLNLDYRQGPNLPTLKYAYPDSHFICVPLRDPAHRHLRGGARCAVPCGVSQAVEDATGAALKAIQAAHAAAEGVAVHPRSGDMSFPEFAMQRCTQCKRCTEECPFGAINEDEKANPLAQPHPLPPLRRVHGRLPRAHHQLQELLRGHDRLHDQVHRRARRG